jgi:hypothetical protein
MNHDTPAYGLWSLVVINTAVFLIFAFSFTHPRTARDWRSFGAFAALVCWVCSDHARLSASVANATPAGHVPHLGDKVRPAGPQRGARSTG